MAQTKRPGAPLEKDRLGVVLKILTIAALLASLGIWTSAPSALGGNPDRAVQIGMVSSEGQAISRMSYVVTVPAFPAVQAQGAYEFHAGVLSSDGSTLIKTTVSYGCQIGAHLACFPPFINRYIFYISDINTATGNRTQAPAQGWVLTPGSTYTIVLTLGTCPSLAAPEWAVRVSNASSKFSTSLCLTGPLAFNSAVAGVLEAHDINSCSQLSSGGSVSQREIGVFSRLGASLPLNWSQTATPNIDCGIGVHVFSSGHDVQIFWNPT